MAVTVACIAGEEVHRQVENQVIPAEKLGPKSTPFGPSGDIFCAEAHGQQFYMLGRYGTGLRKTAPHRINNRANIYALKELGVNGLLAWGAGRAIKHDVAGGDLVVLSDLIDLTALRERTFFEDSPLGFLRQFPLFCPTFRRETVDVLGELGLPCHPTGTAAVFEGPRFETPAEVRMFSNAGAGIVTHAFVPEVFLAKELQMCYAAICYVVDYAETGSRHRPFATGELFGSSAPRAEQEHLVKALDSLARVVARLAEKLASAEGPCDCAEPMAEVVARYDLPEDWRQWFRAHPNDLADPRCDNNEMDARKNADAIP